MKLKEIIRIKHYPLDNLENHYIIEINLNRHKIEHIYSFDYKCYLQTNKNEE